MKEKSIMTSHIARYISWVCVATLFVLLLASCSSSLPPTTPGGGWSLFTIFIPKTGPMVYEPGVTVNGTWKNDLPGAAGSANPFTVVTDSEGYAEVTNGRAPAVWSLLWVSGGPPGCLMALSPPPGAPHSEYTVNVTLHAQENFLCVETSTAQDQVTQGATMSPPTLYTQALPPSVTVNGSGFSAQYGMPLLTYYDLNGNLVAQIKAASVAPGGNSLSVATPSLSQVVTGTYVGTIQNANGSGGYNLVTGTTVDVIAPPGLVTFVAMPQTCTDEYHNSKSWTVYAGWEYLDATGRTRSFPIQVSSFSSDGAECGAGPAYSANAPATDGSGYVMYANAYPGVSLTTPTGGNLTPPLEPR